MTHRFHGAKINSDNVEIANAQWITTIHNCDRKNLTKYLIIFSSVKKIFSIYYRKFSNYSPIKLLLAVGLMENLVQIIDKNCTKY